MKLKILFALLAVVLLSLGAAAAEPKSSANHISKSGKALQMSESYAVHMKDYVLFSRAAAAAGIVPGGGAASAVLIAASSVSAAKAQSYRGTIQKRGLYAFYDFVDAYDDWSGLSKYGALFYGEDVLAKRRQMAADYFCEHAFGLLGGKGCWQSRICEPYYRSVEMPAGRSVLVAQQGVGGFLPAVSVQGEKSLPVSYKEAGKSKVKYVYKVTYSIANPDLDRQLTYRVRLVGSAHSWASDAFVIEASAEGSVMRDDRLGGNPFVMEAEQNYDTVCLAFSPRMRMSDWSYVSELCSPLVQYEGAASRPYAGGAS